MRHNIDKQIILFFKNTGYYINIFLKLALLLSSPSGFNQTFFPAIHVFSSSALAEGDNYYQRARNANQRLFTMGKLHPAVLKEQKTN